MSGVAAIRSGLRTRGGVDYGAALRSGPLAPASLRFSDRMSSYTSDPAGASVRTVETHRAHLQQKLGLKARADLVRYAREIGLLEEEPGP